MSMPPKLELYDQLACEEIYFRNSTIITLPQSSRPFSQHSAAVHPPLASLGNFVLPTESVPSTLKTTEDLIYVTADPPASDKDSPTLPNGPDNDKLCHSPPVLAASAALQMRLIVTTGILSVLTTGWYSSISDRYGRTAILRVAILGLLMQDLLIIIIGHVSRDRLPLGNDFLMIGAVFEGVVGGYPTLAAAHQAYIADSTPAGTRAQVFGFFMALLFAGFAIGPTLGGWLVSKTGSLMSAFYLATAAHLIYTIVIYFVIPESSSRHTMDKAQKDRALQLRIKEEKWEATYKDRSKLAKWCAIAWERVQAPLLPLKMLLPKRIYADEDEDEVGPTQATPLLRRTGPITHGQEASASHISVSHISRKKRWDMNLTLLSLGNFTETMVIGIMASKMLYGQQMFNWGAREIGTYMTASSLGRVLALSLVLPLVIKLVHPPKKRLNLPQDADASGRDLLDHEGRPKSPAPSRDYGSIESTKERGPNNNGRATAASSSSSADANEDRDLEDSTETDAFLAKSWTEHERSVEEMWTLRAKHLRMIHDSKFDLRLARTSVLIMLITYAALPFAKDGLTYIVITCLTSLGSGGGAAMSSLALALLRNPRDAGKLFGAWSVMGAIGQTVLGPFLFTYLFERTAGTAMPYAIFLLATGESRRLLTKFCYLLTNHPFTHRPLRSFAPLPPPRARPQDTVVAAPPTKAAVATYLSRLSRRRRSSFARLDARAHVEHEKPGQDEEAGAQQRLCRSRKRIIVS